MSSIPEKLPVNVSSLTLTSNDQAADGRPVTGFTADGGNPRLDAIDPDTEDMPDDVREQIADIVALMARGRTPEEAARRLKIHGNQLRHWLMKYPRAFEVGQRINIEGMAHRYRSHMLRMQERLVERSGAWVDVIGDIAENKKAPPGIRVNAAKAGLGLISDFVSRKNNSRGSAHPEEINTLLRNVLPAMWDQPTQSSQSYVVEAKVTVTPKDDMVIDVTPEEGGADDD